MPYEGYLPALEGDVDVLGEYEILGEDYDILGEDEDLLGEEDDDMMGDYDVLGARRRRRRVRGRAMRRPRGSGAASHVIKREAPQKTRLLSLPMDSVANVAAGGAATINLTPVEPFRTEAIMVDPTIAASFLITTALVGRKSQFVAGNALACTLCPPTAPFRVQWDTAQTSQPIQIGVTNTSGAALRFMGQLLGTVVTS